MNEKGKLYRNDEMYMTFQKNIDWKQTNPQVIL